ncbi:MAG: TolC family protein [Bacteroidales bacterium]|nr:TolC family protein [Bacteroidales bacterium]
MKKLLYILLLFCPVLVVAQGYTLEQCINMAFKNSYDIKNSRLDYEMADQTKKEVFTKYFPSISAAGMAFDASEYLINENIDLSPVGKILAGMGYDPIALGLPSSIPVQMIKNGAIGFVSATQPVFAGGQIINGNKLAKVGRDVSKLKITLSENEVISKTEEYFWQIVSLKEKLKTLDVADTQLAELNKKVKAAVSAGLTTRNDLLRVELQQQNMESNRIKVDNGIKIYKLLLCNITGAAVDSFDIAISGFPIVKDPLEYYISAEQGIEGRTENQLLEKGVKAASLQYKMAIGKNMPTVAAGAGYIYQNLLEKDVNFGMIFATVSVPISSWWGGSHAIKREKYNEIKTENQRKDMRKMMAVDIESKWNILQESYLQIRIALKSIESATENLHISCDYYNAGTVSLADLLEAQTLLQQGRDQYTNACTTYYVKLSAYMQATGRYPHAAN